MTPTLTNLRPESVIDPTLDAAERTLLTRRLFLQAVAAGITVSALPAWLAEPAAAAAPLGAADGVLVLVTMSGGNDGLNTFIPMTDGTYHDRRPHLAIGADRAIALGGGRGLHPRLGYFKQQWDKGNLAIIDGVGLGDTTLSHFDSTARMMTLAPSSRVAGTGWLGRYLDGLGADPFNGVSVGSSLPVLVKGRSRQAIAVPEQRSNIFNISEPNSTYARQFRALRAMGTTSTGLGPLADRLTAGARRAVDLAGTVYPLVEDRRDEAEVITKFRLAARLINADLGIRVLSISFGDFDSHANQASMHDERMTELNAAMQVFHQALNPAFVTRTLVVGTSEFGRRVKDNGSGTDHGVANSLFAIGHQVNGGIHGQMPSLINLDGDKNLKTTVGFSHFYGNILNTWLRADSAQILGRDYGDLGFLNPPGKPLPGKTAPVVGSPSDRVTRRASISRLYLAFFGTLPDEEGMAFWSEQLIRGSRNLSSVSQALAQSEQFARRYGRVSNRQFVELVYSNVLDRDPDGKGLEHWVGVLNGGGSRGSVMVSFSESDEFKRRTAKQAWWLEEVGPIGRLYRAYFLRRPDERGLTHWINTGLELRAISDTFANSTEFLNRYGTLNNRDFVSLVYRNVLGRQPDARGREYWTERANRGVARGDIMTGFSESREFAKKVRALTN
ncbi:MAG: DUF4214 domain-containing protein [Acidimicrobiia bacterium]|nr:DUF4214 domain-containing protein [Acidimicrobiia bacterium]